VSSGKSKDTSAIPSSAMPIFSISGKSWPP
jgi:hypothetical protein